MSGATRAMKQRGDVRRAEEKVRLIAGDLAELEAELADEIREVEEKYDALTTDLEPEVVKPYKKDIDVRVVGLLWLPFDEEQKPVW